MQSISQVYIKSESGSIKMRLTLPGTTVLATSIVLICLCHSVVLAQEGPGLSETPQTRAAVEEPPPSIDYQTQIYIVSGTLGGILLLLIILVLALALSVAKLKDQLEKRQKSYLVDDNNINHNPDAAGLGRDQIHAYDNSAFTGVGDATEMQERSVDAKMEIARRGYTVYNGNSHENRHPSHVRDSRATLMRYEDGVIPISEKQEGNRQNSRPYRY
eukprot:TCALIF_00071-PB protein Name:"Protein of unknown function" AED:0.03 eAED:0.03 QI:173/1/1/1/0.4/0.66/6/179/215